EEKLSGCMRGGVPGIPVVLEVVANRSDQGASKVKQPSRKEQRRNGREGSQRANNNARGLSKLRRTNRPPLKQIRRELHFSFSRPSARIAASIRTWRRCNSRCASGTFPWR